MFDDRPSAAFDEQGIAPQFGPHTALEIARWDSVDLTVVADCGVHIDPSWFLMDEKDL